MIPREEHQQELNEEPVARNEGEDACVNATQQMLEDVTHQVGDVHEAKNDQLGPGSAHRWRRTKRAGHRCSVEVVGYLELDHREEQAYRRPVEEPI